MADLLKKIHREIDGKTYIIQELPAKSGRAMLVRLLKLGGPAVSSALRGLTGDNISLGDMSPGALGDAILSLCSSLNEEEFESIYQTFAANTSVVTPEGGEIPLSRMSLNDFSGNYGAMIKFMGAHIEHNYGNFLDVLGLTNRQG